MAEDHPIDAPNMSSGSEGIRFLGLGLEPSFRTWGVGLPTLISIWAILWGGFTIFELYLLLIWIGGILCLGFSKLIEQGKR